MFLRSRNIPVDVTCPMCNADQESICHLLFTCSSAQEVWRNSLIPTPPAGFSQNSVLLNLHYLLSMSAKARDQESITKSFPWILWHIWKARNSLCFEQFRLETSVVLSKASDDFMAWLAVQKQSLPQPPSLPVFTAPLTSWSKPPPGVVKCNFGSSWLNPYQNSGVAWIARNHLGTTLFHSRRSYSSVSSSLENDLMSMQWAIESLRNLRVNRVIFQGSSVELRSALLRPSLFPLMLPLISQLMELLNGFEEWSMEHTSMPGNQQALAIAASVTRDRRYQSYIAKDSPSWLHSLLISDASTL